MKGRSVCQTGAVNNDGGTTKVVQLVEKEGSLVKKKKKTVCASEIRRKYGLLLDSLGLPPGSDERASYEKKSLTEQNKLVKEWKSDGPGPEDEILYFIDMFKQKKMDLEKLDELLEVIGEEDHEWVQDFARSNGFIWLFESFTFAVYKLGTIRGGDDEVKRLEVLIDCLFEMFNLHDGAGMKELIVIPHSFDQLFMGLAIVEPEYKIKVFEFLSAILLVDTSNTEGLDTEASDEIWRTITEAWSNLHRTKRDEFQAMFEEFEFTDDPPFKIAMITFINTMIVRGNTLVERVKVRADLLEEGILEILKELKTNIESGKGAGSGKKKKSKGRDDADLLEQIEVFEEEMECDAQELKALVQSKQKQQQATSSNNSTPPNDNNNTNSVLNPNKNTISVTAASTSNEAELKKLREESQRLSTELEDLKGLLREKDILITKQKSQIETSPSSSTISTSSPSSVLPITPSICSTPPSATVVFPEYLLLKPKAELLAIIGDLQSLDSLNTSSFNITVATAIPLAPGEESVPEIPSNIGENTPPPPCFEAPPPPGVEGPPPPGRGPPPGGGIPASKTLYKSFQDPDRPAMIPWRWNKIPDFQCTSTVFNGLAEQSLKLIESGKLKTSQVESTFAVTKKLKLGTTTEGEGDKAVEEAAKAAATKGKDPVMLDISRLMNIGVVMHKFKDESIDVLISSLLELDPRVMTIQRLTEMRNLFPLKTYEEDVEKVTKYKESGRSVNELKPAERMIYEFITRVGVGVRNKIVAALFCLESQGKLAEAVEYARMVDHALSVLKSDKLVKVLEISLALGNYVNNPREQVKGFKISSLVKLMDVHSKLKPKYTLMHELAAIVEQSFPELLSFPDELASGKLDAAGSAVESLTAGVTELKQDLGLLLGEFENESGKKEGEGTGNGWGAFFEKNVGKIRRKLDETERLIGEFESELKYFGESGSIGELVHFLKDWDKFVTSFQTAVKYNITLRRKEEALEKKSTVEEKKRLLLEKKREGKRLKKEKILEEKKEMLKKKQDQIAKRRANQGAGKGKAGPDKTKSIIKSTDDLVNDLLKGGKGKDEGGTVNKMMSALRNDTASTFKQIRGSRIQVPEAQLGQVTGGVGRGVGRGRARVTSVKAGEEQDKLVMMSAAILQDMDLENL